MTSSDVDKSQIRYARLAGFMYLFVMATEMLGSRIISRFEVPGNFAETAHRIAASEALYRVGLSSQLLGCLCIVFLAMGLYVAVKPIDSNLALLALVFELAEATLGGAMLIFRSVALRLYIGADGVSAFDASQLSALVKLHSAAYSAGYLFAALFFSMGSTIFFFLFLRSTYIPKVLSVLGVFSSVLAAVAFFGLLIFPGHAAMLKPGSIPIVVVEMLVGLWLLFKGLNLRPRTD
jgi:uncharacterized protein DUF4386